MANIKLFLEISSIMNYRSTDIESYTKVKMCYSELCTRVIYRDIKFKYSTGTWNLRINAFNERRLFYFCSRVKAIHSYFSWKIVLLKIYRPEKIRNNSSLLYTSNTIHFVRYYEVYATVVNDINHFQSQFCLCEV